MERTIVKLPNGKEVLVKNKTFEQTGLDAEDLFQIDYSNLLAELATAPVILNRMGLWLADMDAQVSLAELKLRVKKAQIRKLIRIKFVKTKQKITNDPVDDDMRSNPLYIKAYEAAIESKLQRDKVSSLYWSMKAKVDNLNKLSLTLQPGDIDVDTLVPTFNDCELKAVKD